MLHSTRRVRSARRGAAAVEAAFACWLLIFFFAASYELGRLGKIADSLSNAARNGAQYGSASTTAAGNSSGIRAAAVTELSGLPNVTSSNPTVTSTTVSSTSGSITQSFIQVTVTYDMTGTSIFSMFNVTSMSRTVQMPMMPQ
jgi:hypothetical protein